MRSLFWWESKSLSWWHSKSVFDDIQNQYCDEIKNHYFDEIKNHYFDEMITTKAKLYSALAKGNWVKTKLKIRFEENAFGDENAFWKQTKFITFFIKLTIHSPPHHYASLFCCLRYSPLFWSSSSLHMKYQRRKACPNSPVPFDSRIDKALMRRWLLRNICFSFFFF